MFTRKRSLALLTIACASTWSVGASAETTAFELGSYLDFPGGREISERDYAGAIKSASAGKSIDPLVGATNLCVAYTATGAYPEARGACDLALELARRVDSSTLRPFPSETATSRALSNRGVLRALNGDVAGAAGDFRAATKAKQPWAAAVRNLAYLESAPNRVASSDGK